MPGGRRSSPRTATSPSTVSGAAEEVRAARLAAAEQLVGSWEPTYHRGVEAALRRRIALHAAHRCRTLTELGEKLAPTWDGSDDELIETVTLLQAEGDAGMLQEPSR